MNHKIGLYPIVDESRWVKEFLSLGVKTIQLRIKNGDAIDEIKQSVTYGKRYDAAVFINDYWEEAITHDAFGVHLGQEDIKLADIEKIKRAGLRLGISTHNNDEMNNALRYQPTYIAYGPIYHTNTKPMPYTPRGLDKLRNCVEKISCPVVAIGGISFDRLPGVLSTGVDGVAVLSAILNTDNPSEAVKIMMRAMENKNAIIK